MSISLQDIHAERVRREQMRRKARSSFLTFTQYTKPNYDTNWHHAALAEKLDWWMHTPNAKLIVCMPPRHGKSELVSRRLPAYILGQLPASNIIACSYGQDLANSMSRDVQNIMDSPAYLSLFPGSRRPFRAKERKRDAVEEWGLAYRDGGYKAAGVGGGITGRGFDFGIIDDPLKDDSAAQSAVLRERIWYWYYSTFLTRRQPGARVLITMTRWHQDDLVGRLLDAEKDWETIVLPAVKEDAPTIPEDKRKPGEFLWEPWFGPDQIESIKAVARVWNAAYRQQPSEGEGNVFKKGMFKRYSSLPAVDNPIVEYVLSVDASFGGKNLSSSRVSMSFWGRTSKPVGFYLLDEECDQMGFLETLERAKAIIERWPEARGRLTVLVEDKANGPAIIEAMGLELPCVVPVTPRESKPARASAVLPVFRAGNVYFPEESYLIRGEEQAFWVRDYIDELKEFPYHAYNDRVDSTSQALLYFIENTWDLNFGRLDVLEDDETELFIGSLDEPGNGHTNGKTIWTTNPFSLD